MLIMCEAPMSKRFSLLTRARFLCSIVSRRSKQEYTFFDCPIVSLPTGGNRLFLYCALVPFPQGSE